MYAADLVPDAPQRIDHTLPPAKPVLEGPTVEQVMPLPSLAALNDTDGEALYLFLQTLPKGSTRP